MEAHTREKFTHNLEGRLAHSDIRVCVVRGPGVIAPHIMDAYQRAFRRLGVETRLLDIAAPEPDTEGIRKQLDRLASWRPALAICYGYSGVPLARYLRAAGIPLVLLFYDSPFGLSWNMYRECISELLASSRHCYCFVWDRAYIGPLRQVGLPHVFPIMLAADTSIFRPRSPAYRFNVSFAGRMGNLDDLRSQRRRAANTRVNEFTEKLIDRKIASPSKPLQRLWAELVRESFPEMELDWRRPGMGELHLHIHREGTILMRRSILGSVRSARLDVFGADWNIPGASTHGSVDYVRELPALYADSQINLNISAPQLEYSVNNRIFDVAAVGGFLLTDYREDLQQVFPDFDRMTYHDGRELDARIAHYLANEPERLELAAALQKEVLRRHTYEHRALYVLQSMAQSASGEAGRRHGFQKS